MSFTIRRFGWDDRKEALETFCNRDPRQYLTIYYASVQNIAILFSAAIELGLMRVKI